jgi:hypothetical protein
LQADGSGGYRLIDPEDGGRQLNKPMGVRAKRQKLKEDMSSAGVHYAASDVASVAAGSNAGEKREFETVDRPSEAPIQDEAENLAKAKAELEELEKMKYGRNAYVIPSSAAWFAFDKMHELEMAALPEYFCGKFPHKNPETYLQQRNFMIKLYREQPQSYLSGTECRKKVTGDICSVLRLHGFLEHWGLINFNADQHLKPPKHHLSGSGVLDEKLIELAEKGFLTPQDTKDLHKRL